MDGFSLAIPRCKSWTGTAVNGIIGRLTDWRQGTGHQMEESQSVRTPAALHFQVSRIHVLLVSFALYGTFITQLW